MMMRFWRRKQFENEMEAELRFHIEARADDLMRSNAGLSHVEALRRARIEFGAVEASKEECRQAWGLQFADELSADMKLAWRTVVRNPGFAAVAIFSLALGIGANTAIFSVMDAVMLRLLPVRDPGRLAFVWMVGSVGRDGPPFPMFELIRDQAKGFVSVAAYSPSAMELSADSGRELAKGLWVTGNFYDTLGVHPLAGRGLSSMDDQTVGKGGPDGAVAVISDAYWERRFGRDPATVGRVIRLFQYSVKIVGVLPSEIMSLEPGIPIDIAVPMALSDPAKMRDRTALWLGVVARLDGLTPAQQVLAGCEALFQAYMADAPVSAQMRQMLYQRMDLSPAGHGLSGLRRQFSNPLMALTILAGMVLLAACVNMSGLMLARATARQRDFAVRLAIGADRTRLIRQTLTEALTLTAAGTLLGALFAQFGETALARLFAAGRNPIVLDLSLNLRVLAFTAVTAVLSGLLLGIAPAMRASALDPASGLQGGSRNTAGGRQSMRVVRWLVVVQVALSLVLMAGAGLFVRSLARLESTNPGFRRDGILTMEVTPERQMYGTAEWLGLQSDLLDQIAQLPGVQSAGFATMTPLSGRDRGAVVEVPGFAPRVETDTHIHLTAVTPRYFETLGLPLTLGRGFTEHDDSASVKVAIVNETAARFYFDGSTSPLGRKLRFTNYRGREDLTYEIVGVVKDAKHDSLREEPSRFIYLPVRQSVDRINRLALAVYASGDPMSLAAPIRQNIQKSHSTLLISNVSTMERQIAQTLLRERLLAAMSTAFGTVALSLTCVGVYGILAYSATRRAREIGIRMALGATRNEMIWLVAKEGLLLASAGIAAGIPVAVALGGIAKALLFGVEGFDPPVFAGAVLLLLLFALLAGFAPALRAARFDPMTVLGSE